MLDCTPYLSRIRNKIYPNCKQIELCVDCRIYFRIYYNRQYQSTSEYKFEMSASDIFKIKGFDITQLELVVDILKDSDYKNKIFQINESKTWFYCFIFVIF